MSLLPKIFRASLMCIALVIGVAQICPANPIVAVTTSNGGNATNNQAQTIGWAFTTTSNINVTALGLFDAGANGLADPHEIGLWTNSGTLLSMLTIPEGTGTTLVNGFRFVNITPVSLQANQTYVVGAFYRGQPGFGGGAIDPDPDQDSFILSTDSSSFSYASGINFAGDRASDQQISNIMFPGSSTGVFQAFLGPNFLFEAQPATTVPEPATMLLLGTGLTGITTLLRRRKR